MSLEFSFKYKDYEIRACPKRLVRLTPDEPNVTIDFVKWATDNNGERYCFSLGYFKRDNEGYRFHFVGDRPFRYIASEDLRYLWLILEKAQETLDGFFDKEEFDDD